MIGKKISKFDSLDSTNTYIKQHAYNMNHGEIVWALEQTHGRGRYGNTWQSKSGNLYFSILLKNNEFKKNIFELHIKTSVAIIELLKDYGIEATIKYPNDILVGHKKICGILVETQGTNKSSIVILGIGINVNQNKYEGLSDKATSMNILNNKKYVLENILTNFIDVYNRNESMDVYYKKYIDYSMIIGKYITYNQKRFYIKNIKQSGQLILSDKKEDLTVDYDKISFTHLYFE